MVSCASVSHQSRLICPGEKYLWFYKNHPIRYICICGFVAAIDQVLEKFVILSIDDGSGEIVNVIIQRLRPAQMLDKENPSNTIIPNVNIDSQIGVLDVIIDGTTIDIGTVLQVKGTVSRFRGINQIDMRRAHVVPSTKAESKFWIEMARWKSKISKPWKISGSQLRRLEAAHKVSDKEEKKLLKRKREAEQTEEIQRKKDEATMNEGALI